MDFQPTADQVALQSGVRDLLTRRFPAERLFAVDDGIDRAVWKELADFGVFSLGLAESEAGLGLGHAEAVLVFEELGRALVPGPLVPTFLAAGLPGLDQAAPVAVYDRATTPPVVTHLDAARGLVVVDDDGLTLVTDDEPHTRIERPVDPLSPGSLITQELSGTTVGGPEDAARWRRDGALLTAALQVGIADATTQRAVDYAKQREQFGRTIGSFQAVKHLCADMLVRTELARVAVHAAAVTLDDPGVGDAARAVAGAKILADDAAVANSRACVQVHGGMGFTWDVDVHFFLKRAWVHATEFGSADDHAEALAELL